MIDRSRTNAFEFVIVAGARAKQLMRGCTPRTTSAGSDKIIKIAQREVREGKVEKVIGRDRLSTYVSLIALGVTGGIGAYKAVEVARELQKRDHEVVAVMTRSARKFVGEVTFEAITRRRVITDQYAPGANADIEHIALASNIALLLVAPATANMIGKFAHGIADDFLSSLYLATRAPVLMAPAMNTNMLEHEAVRSNMETLAARGVRFVDPGAGYLACGWIGKGRLAEPDVIAAAADGLLRQKGTLLGRFVVVTAGPTYEDIDDVRYIGNRSSGKMGYAVAVEAARRGARVVLISGPTRLDAPAGVEVVRVRRAAEMHHAVQAVAGDADVIVMAAAVADYAPAEGAHRRQNRETGWSTRADARADAGHPGRARPAARGRATPRSSSDSPPKAATPSRAAAKSCAASRST